MPLRLSTDPERAARRREWLSRALFEAGLILFGILGAFAVNEWQNTRERRDRVATMMTAVQRELESNLRATEEASTYNSGVVDRLRALGAANATTVPPDAHPRGLRREPAVVSAAWDSAQSGGLVNDVPVATVLAIARAYEAQRMHLQQNSRLLGSVYEGLLRPDRSSLPPPGTLAAVLSDFAGRDRGLIEHYRSALDHLNRAER